MNNYWKIVFKKIFIFVVIILTLLLICCKKQEKSDIIDNDDITKEDIKESDVISDNTSNDEIVKGTLILSVNNNLYSLLLADNSTVKELIELINDRVIVELELKEHYQVGRIGNNLLINDEDISVNVGDIVLLDGCYIIIAFEPFNGKYTRIGHISLRANEIVEMFGEEDVSITLIKSNKG